MSYPARTQTRRPPANANRYPRQGQPPQDNFNQSHDAPPPAQTQPTGPTHGSGFTIIPPNERKAAAMRAAQEKGETDYARYLENRSHIKPTSGLPSTSGGQVSLEDARRKQQQNIRFSKLDQKADRERRQREAKRAEEEKLNEYKMEQRRKSEMNAAALASQRELEHEELRRRWSEHEALVEQTHPRQSPDTNEPLVANSPTSSTNIRLHMERERRRRAEHEHEQALLDAHKKRQRQKSEENQADAQNETNRQRESVRNYWANKTFD